MSKKLTTSQKTLRALAVFAAALMASVHLSAALALATPIESTPNDTETATHAVGLAVHTNEIAAHTTAAATHTTAAATHTTAAATHTTLAAIHTAETPTHTPALAPQADAEQVCMTVRVVGPDAQGADTEWLTTTKVMVNAEQNGWDASKIAFDAAGLQYDASDAGWGISLNTITSPYTETPLGWDAVTGKYWQLFVDGEAASVGIGQIEPSDGRSIVWYYSSWNQSLDDAGEPAHTQHNEPIFESLDVTPVQREAVWPEFNHAGSLTQAPTGQAVTQKWATQLGGGVPVSELLLVGDKIYAAVGQSFIPGAEHPYEMTLVCMDAATGAIETSTPLAATVDFTSRPAYANGIIYVPLQGGAVQAINASTMLSRWVSTSALTGSQSSCSIRVRDGKVYQGLAVYGSSGSFDDGALVALDEKTGAPLWATQLEGEGFYWTDVVVRDGVAITGGTNGSLVSLNTETGALLGTCALGSTINADIATWNEKLVVLTRDGVLHVVSLSADGVLTQDTQLKVLGGAKAAPTIVGDVALCGGIADDGSTPAVAHVDLSQLSVIKLITTADGNDLPSSLYGGVSAPILVSQQGEKSYAYFTVNHAEPTDQTWTSFSSGGNLYLFELGSDDAQLLWEPSSEIAQACDSPVIADSEGALYYLNDSGYVVKLSPTAAPKPEPEPQPKPQPKPDPTPTQTKPTPTPQGSTVVEGPLTTVTQTTPQVGVAVPQTTSQVGVAAPQTQQIQPTPTATPAPNTATVSPTATRRTSTSSTGDRTSFELMSVMLVSGMALALYGVLMRKARNN
ncbi:MAG: PQQ-binding-like beta-propeller repeat protein [Atopobiaceae bacterium]|nr:PQQ-binding-like beta-propeller repeat protein [Atopobiaceae bacterium]